MGDSVGPLFAGDIADLLLVNRQECPCAEMVKCQMLLSCIRILPPADDDPDICVSLLGEISGDWNQCDFRVIFIKDPLKAFVQGTVIESPFSRQIENPQRERFPLVAPADICEFAESLMEWRIRQCDKELALSRRK